MEFIIEFCNGKINPKWDAFVNEANGDLLQTSAWASYENNYFGWNAVRFYFKNEETIVAGFQITIINDELVGNIGIIRSGPCFKLKTPELMSLVVSEMRNSIKTLNLSYLMVTPDYNEHDLIPFLKNEKFESKFAYLPPFRIQSTYKCTLFLDLSLSTDDLLKQMNSMRRDGIRKGLKNPFKVKTGDRDDLKVFYDLYDFTVKNHKYTDPITKKTIDYYPTMESYDEVCKIWDALAPYGWVKLFLGTVEDEIICGEMAFPFGGIFHCKRWGWNLKYGKYRISDVIQWEMIQWAKENGYKYYDFCEIDIKVAEAYRSSDPVLETLKTTDFHGPTMFKLQFGGDIIKYPGLYVCYSDKTKQLIETSGEELIHLLKSYKDYFWAKKNFFRNHNSLIS